MRDSEDSRKGYATKKSDQKEKQTENVAGKNVLQKKSIYKNEKEALKKEVSKAKRINAQLMKLHEDEAVVVNKRLLEATKKKQVHELKIKDNILHKTNKSKMKNLGAIAKISDNESMLKLSSKPKIAKTKSTDELDSDWDIEYDKTKPFDDYESPNYDPKKSKMLTIVNVRKRKNNPIELMIEWSCGCLEWGTIDNVWIDIVRWDSDRKMFHDYDSNHGLIWIKNYIESKSQTNKQK